MTRDITVGLSTGTVCSGSSKSTGSSILLIDPASIIAKFYLKYVEETRHILVFIPTKCVSGRERREEREERKAGAQPFRWFHKIVTYPPHVACIFLDIFLDFSVSMTATTPGQYTAAIQYMDWF